MILSQYWLLRKNVIFKPIKWTKLKAFRKNCSIKRIIFLCLKLYGEAEEEEEEEEEKEEEDLIWSY